MNFSVDPNTKDTAIVTVGDGSSAAELQVVTLTIIAGLMGLRRGCIPSGRSDYQGGGRRSPDEACRLVAAANPVQPS